MHHMVTDLINKITTAATPSEGHLMVQIPTQKLVTDRFKRATTVATVHPLMVEGIQAATPVRLTTTKSQSTVNPTAEGMLTLVLPTTTTRTTNTQRSRSV